MHFPVKSPKVWKKVEKIRLGSFKEVLNMLKINMFCVLSQNHIEILVGQVVIKLWKQFKCCFDQ